MSEPADAGPGEQGEVRYAVASGVATLTLDAPARRNALTTAMMHRLVALLEGCGADERCRVVVLSHTGPAFCSGMDLTAASGSTAEQQPVNAFPAVLQAIWACPRPVIARVGGPARAGGIGLLAACDIAVTVPEATFAFTEVRLGVVPAVISLPVRARVAPAAVRELFLTGETFDGRRAAELGLVNTVVEPTGLDAEVARYAGLLGRGGPGALAATKELLRTEVDFGRLLAMSAERFAGAEAAEGMAAYREKRAASWVPADSADGGTILS